MLSQAPSAAADDAHSRAVVTAIRPEALSAGAETLEGPRLTADREIVEGAVDVTVEEPQPDATRHTGIAMRTATERSNRGTRGARTINQSR